MPKRRTAAKGFPADPEHCYDSRHLDGSEYKVYSVMKGFAHAGRTSLHGKDSKAQLLFNASIKPTLANAVGLSRNQTYLVRDTLERKGWIILREKGTRKADGSVSPDTWEILDHEQFVERHPGTCPDYEFAPDFEAAQAAGVQYGQRLRETGPTPDNLYGKTFDNPTNKAIGESLAGLSEEEGARLREHWKTVKPTPVAVTLRVPKVRDRRQSLKLGTANDAGQSLSLESAGPYHQEAPVPKVRTHQSLTLGKNLSTALDTSTHTHTTTPATAIVDKVAEEKSRVCDVLEKNQNLNDVAENDVSALLEEFVAQNNGEAGKCTANQRRQLKELALRHGREKFRAAARAWFADPPWNSRTTDPFLTLIAGFEGYAAKKAHADKQKTQQAREKVDLERTTLMHLRKAWVGYGDLNPEFMASLTQEDRDYIKQVADKDNPESMPPDNGRNFRTEEIEFRKRVEPEPSTLDF